MTRPYHHGTLRVALVAAARARLRRSPGASLSLRELARDVGVSPNAPYRHFPDKDGVTSALAAVGYQELTRLAEVAIARPHPVAGIVGYYSRFAATEPALLELVNAEAFDRTRPESEVMLARDEWFAALVAVIEVEAGKLPIEEASARAAAVWAVLIGTAQLRSHGAQGLLLEEMQPDVLHLVELLVKGR
jgi:AcrR family transcriptional regulator